MPWMGRGEAHNTSLTPCVHSICSDVLLRTFNMNSQNQSEALTSFSSLSATCPIHRCHLQRIGHPGMLATAVMCTLLTATCTTLCCAGRNPNVQGPAGHTPAEGDAGVQWRGGPQVPPGPPRREGGGVAGGELHTAVMYATRTWPLGPLHR